MESAQTKSEVSIIVPVYNEADGIGKLFATLAGQYGANLELIISDGGSTDATLERAEKLSAGFPFPVRMVSGEKGRGRQMNAGAAISSAETLLFLHADSSFADSRALRKALDTLNAAITLRKNERVAAHFSLTFARNHNTQSQAYYYYECKARLHRPGCTHGDQGFLLRRSFFFSVGPYDETLPLLEDTRLAEAIRHEGEWLLLPIDIQTSIRRFESEGLAPRQTLNALLMSLVATGREDFLLELPAIYRSQDHTSPLELTPFLRKIRELIKALSWGKRIKFWYTTGAYVQANAWQAAFAIDVRRNFQLERPAGKGETTILNNYDRYLNYLTNNPPGKIAAVMLVWLWLKMTCLAVFLREYKL